VQKVASKQYIKFGKIVEYEDLVQEGRIGLIKAIKKFNMKHTSINPTNNSLVTNQSLLAYAHSWILAEMQNLYHRSHHAHIPAHTLRAIAFKVTNPGCNTEEVKNRAKLAMRVESLDFFRDNFERNDHGGNNYGHKLSGDSMDPTFEESNQNIFAPAVQQAIKKLNPIEKQIIFMKYGVEDGPMAKTNFIASELNLDDKDVEKILKRAKRILSKNATLQEYNKMVTY
jgi:RNA polymerase sigma factor (sigma-70 family)